MPKYNYKCPKCNKVTVIEASVKADKPERILCGCGAERKRVYLHTQGTETFAMDHDIEGFIKRAPRASYERGSMGY